MVELLAGPLVGAAVADKLEERNWGNLVVALDPGLLGDKEEVKQRVQVRQPAERTRHQRGSEEGRPETGAAALQHAS